MNREIAIVEAKRTPIGAFQGVFKTTPAPVLGAACLKALLKDKNPLELEEVILGCVLTAGLRQAPARQATLLAGLPSSVGATTVNKVCGSGMRALMIAGDMIGLGRARALIAGGMENMSLAPYLLPKVRDGLRMGHGSVVDHMLFDGLEDAFEAGTPMGIYAEKTAQAYGFTRDIQDAFALESVTKAQRALTEGAFSQEIVPMTVSVGKETVEVTQDEPVQRARPEKISQLKPAFLKDGTVTAANASGICDGASALLLMERAYAEKEGIPVRAIIRGYTTFSQEPEHFTTAPVGAIRKLLSHVDWPIATVDAWEINEAFAVVTLAAIKDLGLDSAKVNLHGGACALGHPIGATGARIVTTLLHVMEKYDLKRGVASPCIGGGEATAIAVERL